MVLRRIASGLRSSSGSHLDAKSLEESEGQACLIAALGLLVCSHNYFLQQWCPALSVPREGPVQLLMQAPHPDPHSRAVTAKLICACSSLCRSQKLTWLLFPAMAA